MKGSSGRGFPGSLSTLYVFWFQLGFSRPLGRSWLVSGAPKACVVFRSISSHTIVDAPALWRIDGKQRGLRALNDDKAFISKYTKPSTSSDGHQAASQNELETS